MVDDPAVRTDWEALAAEVGFAPSAVAFVAGYLGSVAAAVRYLLDLADEMDREATGG